MNETAENSLLNGCRVCGLDDQYSNLFYNINRILLKNLTSLLENGTEITEENGSKFICRNCAESVEEFIRFRQKYKETSAKARLLLEETSKVTKEDYLESEFEIELLDETVDKEALLPSADEEEIIVEDIIIKSTLPNKLTNEAAPKPMFQCLTCFKTYAYKISLNRHIKTTHELIRHFCEFCSSEFTQKSSLAEHIRNLHVENLNNLICKLCSRTFNTQKMLQQHMKSHEGKKLQNRKTATILDDKPTSISDKKYRKQCTTCGLFFKHIKEHKLTHENEKTFHCSFQTCDKSFKFKTSLDVHTRIHKNERKFSCSICNKAFRVAHHLKEHTTSVHSVEKKFTCIEAQCQKKFSSKLNLYKHSKLHLKKAKS